jgi:HD-like signal output (HDOD) protein
MIDKHEFLETLQLAIQQNKITLPTLPEVALKVKAAVDKENSTAVDIAAIINTDAAIAARLLQVANSPLYRGRVTIDSVQMAVTRLGIRLVRSLVSSLIMQQIFQSTSAVLEARFRALWEESVHVAALSRVLSYQQPQLDSEQAMLAGLIHNIGGLPVLALAEKHDELVNDADKLDEIIAFVGPTIGSLILKNWEFPEALAKIPEHYNDGDYDSGGSEADFVDLVIVARQQIYQLEGGATSLDKLGFEADVDIVNIEGIEEEVIQVEEILLC